LLIKRLRQLELVDAARSDADLVSGLDRARQEHAALDEEMQSFNSPHERIRVFLEPFLTSKGRKWAVPLESLKLSDE